MQMWNRAYLKQQAKESLRKNFIFCVGICIAASVLIDGLFGVTFNVATNDYTFYIGLGSYVEFSFNLVEFYIVPTIAVLIGLLTLLYSIFISNPINVGRARFFLENRTQASSFEALFYVFKNGWYMNVVKTMFLRDLYTILWTLLFIIPGIYKAYQYYMIPYILAENPDMPHYEVFELTKQLTKGVKLDIFIFELSFVGWNIVGLLACGVGILFVVPYVEASKAELYIYQRDQAISMGILEPEYEETTIHEGDLNA